MAGHSTQAPSAAKDSPSPLGLLFLGLTTAVFNLHALGIFPLSAAVLGSAILYGALGQIAVGLHEWRQDRSVFGAVAFTAFGLFWLSLVGLAVLPLAGIGRSPSGADLAAYYTIWGGFAFVLLLATFRLERSLQLICGCLVAFFYLLLAGHAADLAMVRAAGAWAGVFGGLTAIGTALARMWAFASARPLPPIGMEVQKRA